MPLKGFDGRSDIEFAAGSVTGYRSWTLTGPAYAWMYPEIRGPAVLRGVRDFWLPGVNEARCLNISPLFTHDAPEVSCGCGFWAYWHPSEPGLKSLACNPGETMFCGVIEAWGHVLIGEYGFRAQKARIVALHLYFAPTTYRVYRFPSASVEIEVPVDTEGSETLQAVIEDRVGEAYPQARMYATFGAMLANHPPDKNYGGGGAP